MVRLEPPGAIGPAELREILYQGRVDVRLRPLARLDRSRTPRSTTRCRGCAAPPTSISSRRAIAPPRRARACSA